MIKELEQTYEHLPKQEGEKQRELMAFLTDHGYEIRLSIYVQGEWCHVAHAISLIDASNTRFNIEDIVIELICRKMAVFLVQRNAAADSI